MFSLLAPPRPGYINPDHIVPLSPPFRLPFPHQRSSSSIPLNHSTSTLPATPSTPYAHGTRPTQSPPPHPSSTPIRPCLTLPPRLFLITLSPALLPLILTIAHLIQNRSSTSSLATSLKSSLLSACNGLATGAAALQSLPRYLAMQTNDQAVRATQASILAVGAALVDCVTIIETVAVFIVDTYRSMLLCTFELAIRGTLEIIIEAVKTISDEITSTLGGVRSEMQNDISSANNIIQQAVDKINSVTSHVNIEITVPQFSIPSLTSLQNVSIPTGFEDTLIQLNSSLPTLSELKDKMNSIIEIPFQALKNEINETRLEMASSFNSSILPVPPLSQLSAAHANDLSTELCGDLDTSLIDDTANALHKLSNVAIGLMFLLLFLVWGALCIWEWKRWKVMKDMVETVEDEWKRDNGKKDAWRVVAIVEHPMLEKYGTTILHRITRNPDTRSNLRWYMAYLSHPTCLALLFIAALGFLSLQFQMLALDAIKSHARVNANATVTASANSLAGKLNAMAMSSSREYADDFNKAIAAYQDRIDNELFGSWLNTTAVTLNSTLVEFYGGVEDALSVAFGGTTLINPINTFIYCILGSKIDNLEQGLTWISQHAKITLPTLPSDILLLSSSSMNEIAQPISAAAVGSGGGDGGGDEGIVGSLIEHFESALRVERNFYAVLLSVWLGFALIGLFVVLWHSGGKDRYDAWKSTQKSANGEDGDYVGISKFWPGKTEQPIYDQHTDEERQFKGTSPIPTQPIPRFVEHAPRESSSSFEYKSGTTAQDSSTSRPIAIRKTTLGSITSLFALAQAFLNPTSKTRSEDGQNPVEGMTSEKYNLYHDQYPSQISQPAQPYHARGKFREILGERDICNRDYLDRAVDSAKSMFPTRGQKHGMALMRNASDETGGSFGAGRMTTTKGTTANTTNGSASRPMLGSRPSRGGVGVGSEYVDTQEIGRAIDGIDSGPRYPTYPRPKFPPTQSAQPPIQPTSQAATYPRALSRAPTLVEGSIIPRSHPSDSSSPPLPSLPPPFPSKHDSIDCLRHSTYPSHSHSGFDTRHSYPYQQDGTHEDVDDDFYPYPQSTIDPYDDPTHDPIHSPSSTSSYLHTNDAQVETAKRVETETQTLAAVLAEMKNQRGVGNGGVRVRGHGHGHGQDPFSTPFDDEHVSRGNRI